MAALIFFSLIHCGFTPNTFPSKSELSFLRLPFYQRVFLFFAERDKYHFQTFPKKRHLY